LAVGTVLFGFFFEEAVVRVHGLLVVLFVEEETVDVTPNQYA
jgi:hypothetical protein